MNPAPALKQLLIHDLPPGFVRALLERVANIYPDSYAAMFNDPSLGSDQAKYALGYYRRAQAETVLMNTAAEHGLEVKSIQPESGGVKQIYVSVGRFGFTMCHVDTAAGFPKFSDTREQSSKINEHISQIELFPVDTNPSNDEYFGVLVHTEQNRSKDAFGSLYLGFPNPDFTDWIDDPINFLDILDIQQRLFQSPNDLHATLQDTTPVWKSADVTHIKKREDK
jgi:hypothetical protein